MAKRDTSLVGVPCWFDLSTSDPAGARAFYGALFGWDATEPNAEFGGYFNFTRNGELIAGGMQAMEPGMPDLWSVYLSVSDTEATTKAVEAAGGGVIVPAMAVGDLGTMAVFTDPSGAAIGTWEPGTHLGTAVLDEPGAPSWFELHTRDFAAATAFYQDVFGWQLQVQGDSDDFRYSMAVTGDTEFAGMMDASSFLPEGVPSAWAVYIQVDDVAASAAKAVELGGAIAEPAVDTPYGVLARITDPTGASIRLRSQPS